MQFALPTIQMRKAEDLKMQQAKHNITARQKLSFFLWCLTDIYFVINV